LHPPPSNPVFLLFERPDDPPFFFLPLPLSIKSIGADVVDIVDLGADIIVFGADINFGADADIAAFGADVVANFFFSNSAMIIIF
jgi:hypothetical protein